MGRSLVSFREPVRLPGSIPGYLAATIAIRTGGRATDVSLLHFGDARLDGETQEAHKERLVRGLFEGLLSDALGDISNG